MAKKMMWRDRLRWVASLPLPDQYALILVIFCVEADDRGAMPFLWRKLERLTRFERIDFERAISEFMAWGLMRPDGVDERFDADRYVLEYGSTMDLQLSLGVHGMLARIALLTTITDRQELALSKPRDTPLRLGDRPGHGHNRAAGGVIASVVTPKEGLRVPRVSGAGLLDQGRQGWTWPKPPHLCTGN